MNNIDTFNQNLAIGITLTLVLIAVSLHLWALFTGRLRGPQGFIGVAGEPGAQGPMGDRGPRGHQGPQGLSGSSARPADTAPVMHMEASPTVSFMGGPAHGHTVRMKYAPPFVRVKDTTYHRVLEPGTGEVLGYIDPAMGSKGIIAHHTTASPAEDLARLMTSLPPRGYDAWRI